MWIPIKSPFYLDNGNLHRNPIINIRWSDDCFIFIMGILWKMVFILKLCPGPRFNINTTSHQYRKSHCGDKTILRLSHLHNGISYTGKTTSLYLIGAPAYIWNPEPSPKCVSVQLVSGLNAGLSPPIGCIHCISHLNQINFITMNVFPSRDEMLTKAVWCISWKKSEIWSQIVERKCANVLKLHCKFVSNPFTSRTRPCMASLQWNLGSVITPPKDFSSFETWTFHHLWRGDVLSLVAMVAWGSERCNDHIS